MRCGAAAGDPDAAESATVSATRSPRKSLDTNPPSARGSMVSRRAAGLLTRGHPLHRLPGSRASGTSAEGLSLRRVNIAAGGLSPYSGGTVPDLHRVPSPLAYRAGAYH